MKPSILILTVAIFLPVASLADLIRVEYEAEVRTVTNTPFGNVAPMGTKVTGYIVYDTSIPDTYVISTPSHGEYVHTGTGDFEAVFPTMVITGSKAHTVVINDSTFSDTFRINDGGQDIGLMKIDGISNENVELGFSITAGGDAFSSDAQPNPFPLASTESPYPHPNTFTLSDENGILSLQLLRVSLPRTYTPVEMITFTSGDDSVKLDWIPVVNKTYSIEFSTSLMDWVTIAGGISGGTYTDMLLTRYAPDVPPLAGFYRVYE